ncbi:MAG: BamA/TamA family outer membrane protein [Bacteroidales bacterium]
MKYILSGVSLNAIYDSRDNLMNPYKGYFANIIYRYNPTFLASDQNSSSLWLEFRTYVPLSNKTPRHLVAFWTFGSFLLTGDQPYLTLMGLGEDQKSRSGRAYVAGR